GDRCDRRLHPRERHDANALGVGAAREATAEISQGVVDLTAESSSLAAELGGPPPIDEVLTAVDEEQPCLAWFLAHLLRHIDRRHQARAPPPPARPPAEEIPPASPRRAPPNPRPPHPPPT